jgi:hypothetical protein
MPLKVLLSILLLAATLWVYWPVGSHDFVSLDDYPYVVNNPHVTSGMTAENISWAFTTVYEANWHPLTWLSHMADCALFGLNPRGHHLANLFFHLANTLLLFHLLRRLTARVGRSAFVAALFALHPLHVESVAWVAERKDVLSTFFLFLTLIAYARYAARPGPSRYLLTLALFGLGLMTKPMLVTLPCVMLLLDHWPLGRMGTMPEEDAVGGASIPRLLLEKLPFFLLALASCVVTYHAQQRGGSMGDPMPLAGRLANALVSYAGYLRMAFWPHDLAVFYPYVQPLPWWEVTGAALLLAGVTAFCVATARRRPWLLFGWLWYLGTLVPVIGLVKVGIQAMADRYTYVPLIGPFLMATWGVAEYTAGWRLRRPLLGAATLLILLSAAWQTRLQLKYWQDSVTLLRRSIEVTGTNFYANNILWTALHERQIEEHFRQGLALARRRDFSAAIDHFLEVTRLDPNQARAHLNLGLAYGELGKYPEAIAHYTRVLEISPAYREAAENRDRCRRLLRAP